jgi:hypothetical protein
MPLPVHVCQVETLLDLAEQLGIKPQLQRALEEKHGYDRDKPDEWCDDPCSYTTLLVNTLAAMPQLITDKTQIDTGWQWDAGADAGCTAAEFGHYLCLRKRHTTGPLARRVTPALLRPCAEDTIRRHRRAMLKRRRRVQTPPCTPRWPCAACRPAARSGTQ